MSSHSFILLLFFAALSCKNHNAALNQQDSLPPPADSAFPSVSVPKPSSDKTEEKERYDYQTEPFAELKQYPHIKDSATFIKALVENVHIYHEYIHEESINYWKKIKLYGSARSYYLLEYDFYGGSTASFPWKHQYLFSSDGKLLKIISAMELRETRIFPAENKFLVGVSATGKGNGWHEIYRIQADTVAQIFDKFKGNRPQTYDIHDDNAINIPNEFPYTIEDINGDGHNDLVFRGKIKYFLADEAHTKTVPAKYIFLYQPKTGHFTEQENYSQKYAFIYGNTWE